MSAAPIVQAEALGHPVALIEMELPTPSAITRTEWAEMIATRLYEAGWVLVPADGGPAFDLDTPQPQGGAW